MFRRIRLFFGTPSKCLGHIEQIRGMEKALRLRNRNIVRLSKRLWIADQKVIQLEASLEAFRAVAREGEGVTG